MSPHEQLVAARNLIDRDGWFSMGDPGQGKCVVTALANSDTCHTFKAYLALKRQLGLPWNCSLIHIEQWNDTPGRTKAEVLDLFDRAIASTAPEPDLASLNLNENGGRKDWNALESRVAA